MKRRFTEDQIIGILREQEAGGAVKEIACQPLPLNVLAAEPELVLDRGPGSPPAS